MKKYLGLDWGEKRIGSSLANSENRVATPFKTFFSINKLLEFIKLENINFLIIGEPKSLLEGRVNNLKFNKFIQILNKNSETLKYKIFFIDERFTSLEAKSIMNKKVNNNKDSLSAMIILQNYLDQKK